MTKTKKIIKKKLKEPDEFISFTEKAYRFIMHHSKFITGGGILILILILAFFFYQNWEKKKEEKAYQMFVLASEIYQMVNAPSQETTLQDYQKALSKFDEIISKFPATVSGKWSLLYKGNLHLRSGETDEAIKAYENFLHKTGKENLYRSFALEGLGYSYEAKKDYEKAINAYKKILELNEEFQTSGAYLGLGRCYEKTGDHKKAIENYKSFLKIAPKSSISHILLRKISILEKS